MISLRTNVLVRFRYFVQVATEVATSAIGWIPIALVAFYIRFYPRQRDAVLLADQGNGERLLWTREGGRPSFVE